MGAFVLGVLVGWLAEWLLYTFWIKPNEDENNCASLKAELELKSKQISSLQSQLASASDNSKSNSGSSVASNNTTPSSLKASTASTSNVASASKPTATKNASAANATKPKTVSKKTKTSKAANASKKTTTTKKSKKAIKGDDFTRLSGIGPSMSAKLKSIGIDTFEKLASTDDDVLRKKLEESGARMNNNKEAMDSWNEQATVAAKGDFKALKAMQDALKK